MRNVRHCTSRGIWSYAIGLEFQSSLVPEEMGHWQIQYIKDTGDCLPV